ncbi:glycerate kinase [Streptococcus danieliae]|uniref:Glycerate kinase n=1 Tax=Streptococcus danieliae TaxID=747656 RepID=A0A7Z0M7A9_9STRE|nr:glycerate kinase [Streptococcus danieliae]MBF0700049.1 glycerate kinase [Streptococcus danieliae]NYS97225.1 glycerate kinase [Streptococcus danieliae]
MKFLVAIDSFKGSATSVQLNQAAKAGILEALPDAEVVTVPIADGGEGTLEALAYALDGTWVEVETVDLIERPLRVSYFVSGQTAYIESARVVGIDKIDPSPETVERATSFGLAALFRDALNRGCQELVLTLGGSGTSDGGRGLLEGLGAQDRERLAQVRLRGLTDVTNSYAGPQGYAAVFGPQKGATPEQVAAMDQLAQDQVLEIKQEMGLDLQAIPGTGAAGGLGAAVVILGGALEAGYPFMAEKLGLTQAVQGADLVFTGEGRLDRQSLQGKVPVGVAQTARAAAIPVIALGGSVEEVAEFKEFFLATFSIQRQVLPLSQALETETTLANVQTLVQNIIASRYGE